MRGLVEGMSRREESERDRQKRLGRYTTFWMMVGFLACLLAAYRFIEARHAEGLNDLELNLSTGLLGVVASTGVTLFFLDKLNERRDRNNLKQRLKGEAGSRSHDIAISAVEWMEREGWLRGEDGLLQGANLQEARLWDARLDGANLQGAKLEGADLRKSTLIGANLRDADLMFAKLQKAKLNGANLQNADCHGAKMSEVRLRGARLDEADLTWACLVQARLQGAHLQCADLHTAKLSGASLMGADFAGADLTSTESLREAEYHKEASWENAKLSYVDLRGVDFSEANMKGADLECADLEGVILDGTDLRGANLKGARLKGARFRTHDNFKYGFSGDTAPNFEDLSDDEIAHKTNLSGATLPDGKVFTEEMDYSYLYRFTDPSDEMTRALDAYCNRP